jgi:hypothetical protein
MFKLIKLLILIGILAVGWYLLSPLFINKEVDEELDPKVVAALDFVMDKAGEGLQKAGEKLSDTKTEDIQKKIAELKASMDDGTNLSEQIKDEDGMNEFMEAMAKMDDVEMSEDMKEESSPEVLATGSFVTVAHEGTADVKIIYLGDDSGSIVRLEDLDLLNGPDLRVLLSKSSDIEKSGHLGDYVDLGKLKGNKGNQSYTVPADIDVSEYNSVVIYSASFKVVFNSANLLNSN